jgi:hypothetical protein
LIKLVLALVTVLLIGPATTPITASATGAASPFPGCSSLLASHSQKRDGSFDIAPSPAIPQGMRVRCLNAGSIFKMYLLLPFSGNGSNFSQYTAGGASPGTSVVTRYSAIQIDPVPIQLYPLTFRANIADETFSSSTGQLCHSSFAVPCADSDLVTSMPYGVAFDCVAPYSATGIANLDLRGTPFAVVDTFVTRSFPGPSGSTTFVTPQLVNLTGGGYCGWNAPADIYDPVNANPLGDANHGWDLQLTLAI